MQSRTNRFWLCIVSLLILSGMALTTSAGLEEPHRIVSLAPSCAEIVAGLGLAQYLVGVTSFTDYPPEAASLPSVGSYADPGLEAIVSLHPDLVVATSDGNPPWLLQRLSELQVRVVILDLQTYGKIQESILHLGVIAGRQRQARELQHRMRNTAECIQQRTADAARPTVLFVYDLYPLVTPGRGTFTDELIEMAGGRSITRDSSLQYPRLTIETVLARNPEVVIETSMDPETELRSRLEWWDQYPMLRAVQTDRVYVLESRNLDRPSQRITRGFLDLAAALHPERFGEGECSEDQP